MTCRLTQYSAGVWDIKTFSRWLGSLLACHSRLLWGCCLSSFSLWGLSFFLCRLRLGLGAGCSSQENTRQNRLGDLTGDVGKSFGDSASSSPDKALFRVDVGVGLRWPALSGEVGAMARESVPVLPNRILLRQLGQ